VCKIIKKNPTTKDVPVVMLTGKSSAMDKVKGSLAGCQAYLTKPIDSKEFQTTLEKFIKEK
jgi:twitching motility two-component system response regulator PilG